MLGSTDSSGDSTESTHDRTEVSTAAAQLELEDEPRADVRQSLVKLKKGCDERDHGSFVDEAAAFVAEWQSQRQTMETHRVFCDAELMASLVTAIEDSQCSADFAWHALKVTCLLARADANTQALLQAGGVGAALSVLHAGERPATHVEVALALLQNVAYSSEGVASILRNGGVPAVLAAMRAHAPTAAVQRVGLGVLWNLCDSDDHWAAFLLEGPSLVAVLLSTLQLHRSEPRIEESCIDMLWDFSSTGDGQAHILSAGGVPPILAAMRAAAVPDEGSPPDLDLQKKALSMLWNLTISAQGISTLVRHDGVAVVLLVMRAHREVHEVQQNALGVLRNISDASEGQRGLLRARGLRLLLETLETHSKCDEILELCLECLGNVTQGSVQHGIALVLEGGLEAFHAPPLLTQGTAAVLRKRLSLALEAAVPLVGALLHASTTSVESKACVVIGLAYLTLPHLATIPSAHVSDVHAATGTARTLAYGTAPSSSGRRGGGGGDGGGGDAGDGGAETGGADRRAGRAPGFTAPEEVMPASPMTEEALYGGGGAGDYGGGHHIHAGWAWPARLW